LKTLKPKNEETANNILKKISKTGRTRFSTIISLVKNLFKLFERRMPVLWINLILGIKLDTL